MSDHDFQAQQAETFYTVSQFLKDKNVAVMEGQKVTLDLQFVPGDAADITAAIRALTMFGYDVTEEKDGEIEVHIPDLAFTAADIWLHEERTTKIALERGFLPDGWGFWGG